MQRQHQPSLWRVTFHGWVALAATAAACATPPPTGARSTLPAPHAAPAKTTAKATPGTQTIEIVTSQATSADVAIAPNGKWLVFSALGHLFRVSSKGGDAEQLTFGPYYDSEPTVSPEGSRIAFVSNRGTKGRTSIFLMNLSTGQLDELSSDYSAHHPAWSPDGKSIAYVSEGPPSKPGGLVAGEHHPRWVRRIELGTHSVRTISPAGTIFAVAFMNDGRLLWSQLSTDSETMSELVAFDKKGQSTTQLVVPGVVLQLEAQRGGTQMFLGVHRPEPEALADPEPSTVQRVSLPGGSPVTVTEVENADPPSRFSVTEGRLWLGDRGALWSIAGAGGDRKPLELSFKCDLEIFPRAAPRWNHEPEATAAPLSPRRIPKDGGILFTAAGYLWRQSKDGKAPARVFEGEGFEWGPAVPSPDGQHIAFQHSEGNRQELRTADLNGGHARTLVTTDRSVNFQPAWGSSGSQLAYVSTSDGQPHVQLIDLGTGKRLKLATEGNWQPTPHFSQDGAWLYFMARGQLQRVPVAGDQPPQAVTAFVGPIDRALLSPTGKTLAFGRNDEIWLAPVGQNPVTEAEARLFSPVGGNDFSFAPDGSALLFTSGGEVLEQAVGADQPRAVTRLVLPARAAEPLLIRNVRPLDLERGRFASAESIYIAKGRIQWLGPESEHKIPPEVRVLDGAGRFAIPGLIDANVRLTTRSADVQAPTVARMASLVAHGVTTALDPGSDTNLLRAWSDRRAAFGAPVPRLLNHPPIIKTLVSSSAGDLEITEEELRRRVRAARTRGVHGIQAAPGLPWSLQRALADEAAKQGLVVSGQSHHRDQVVLGALLGNWSAAGVPAGETWNDDLLQLIAKSQIYLVTSLSNPWGNALLFQRQPDERKRPLLTAFSSPSDLALTPPPWWARFTQDAATLQRARDQQVANVKRARGQHVSLIPGSSALAPNDFYGYGLHTELWHLVSAGMTPFQALRQATEGAANALGAANHLGTLDAGKLGDLVLLDKDPLQDIKNSLSVAYVVMEGRAFRDGKPFLPSPSSAQDKTSKP